MPDDEVGEFDRHVRDDSPEGRAAMKALVATGRYTETEDSFEWLWREAADVARLVREHEMPHEARAHVHFLLVDTACYDLTQHADRNAIDDDVSAIVDAVRAALSGSTPSECPTCGGNGIIGTAKRDCPDPWHHDVGYQGVPNGRLQS